MDHSMMDHSMHSMPGMDHGGHGGDGDGPMCNMNMIFTWDTTDLCVVFKWWHIRTTMGAVVSMLVIVLLGAGYECVRNLSRRVEAQREVNIATGPNYNTIQQDSHIPDANTARRQRVQRAGLYAFQVFYSFFMMLVFMTYNGWAMLAVTAGAFIGHYIWGESSTRGMSCH